MRDDKGRSGSSWSWLVNGGVPDERARRSPARCRISQTLYGLLLTSITYYYYIVAVMRDEIAELLETRQFLPKPNRRFFLWSLVSLGLTSRPLKAEKRSEPHYRILTADCEVRMSVEYFANSSTDSFRFRDRATNTVFCVSADGQRDQTCLNRFVGSMAIARYNFRSQKPLLLRERVLTIDHDDRISARPPFERVMTLEEETASDIQAFGYNPDDSQAFASDTKPAAVWRLLRQNLYLNDQTNAFLIVHWKHTLDSISLLDVIPGDGTELVSK